MLLINPEIKNGIELTSETNHHYLARDIDLSLWIVQSHEIDKQKVWVDMKTLAPVDIRIIGKVVSRIYPA